MSRGFRVHNQTLPHFVTSTTVHWIPVFCKERYTRVLIDSLIFCIQHKGLLVHAFVIMPNHFHAVVSCTEGAVSDVLRDIKGFTAGQLLKMLEQADRPSWMSAFRNAGTSRGMMQLWQPGLHPEQVHSPEFLRQKIDYIHQNPLRAGFVSQAPAWTNSSAAFYEGLGESPVPISVIEG